MTDADPNIPEEVDEAVEPEMKDIDEIADTFTEEVTSRGKMEVPPEPRDTDIDPPEIPDEDLDQPALPLDDVDTPPLEQFEPTPPGVIDMAHAELERVVDAGSQDDWSPGDDDLPGVAGEPVEHAGQEIRTAEGIEVHQGPDGVVLGLSEEDEAARLAHETSLAAESGTHTDPKVMLPTWANIELDAVQTDTWDVTNQGTNDGVQLRIQTRTVYNDAGDETLWAYYRTMTFDSLGNLVTISLETRDDVDVPEDCV